MTVAGVAMLNLNDFGQSIGSLAGGGSVTANGVNNADMLTVGNDNTSTTFSGVLINATGGRQLALTKVGTGTLTLSGANTNTGATTVTAGTLQVGSAGMVGSLGSGPVTVDSVTSLKFNCSDAVVFANAVGGAGTLEQIGTGTLAITGVQTWGGTATLKASTGTTNLASNPGSDAAYNLAAGVTPATGSATLNLTGGPGELIQLRSISVPFPQDGAGNGLLVIGAASGAHPSAPTGFGRAGGSDRVYLGDGSGNPGLAP